MSKTYEHYHEEFEESPEEAYQRKRREEEDQYYSELIEQIDQIEKMDLDLTESSEEELFNQILRDEREESLDPRTRNLIEKELKNKR